MGEPKLEPCPICGNPDLDVDTGLADLPLDIPSIHCTTVHLFHDEGGEYAQSCPMYAQGFANWNKLVEKARATSED